MTLELIDVSKRYGKNHALHQFSAKFETGLYGILGPNGAGKTTLLNTIVGLIAPTGGSILYNDVDTRKLKNNFLGALGYLPQHPGFYRNYNAYEFLRYMAVVKGLPKQLRAARIDETLEAVNLGDERNKRLGSFSGGMLRRLGIAQALLNDPDLLILDEPSAGLDPMERIRLRNLISRLAEKKTVLLATHIVPDVEHISTEVVLLSGGENVQQARPSQLIDSIRGYVWEVTAEREHEVQGFVQRFDASSVIKRDNDYCLRIVSKVKPCPSAVPLPPSLEDVYLYHFGLRGLGADRPLSTSQRMQHGVL
jgi:ABC-2 type transport system ATP-binding protein